MSSLSWLLLADETTRIKYEWARLQTFSEWWHLPLLVVVCLAVLAYVAWMYRRDSVELPSGVGVLLGMLRLAAFGGLLLAFLDLQKRTERQVVQNSRVAIAADTSLSMGLQDTDATNVPASPSRADQVIAEFSGGELLSRLRENHDVSVYRFDEDVARIALLGKLGGQPSAASSLASTTGEGGQTSEANTGEPAQEPVDWKEALMPRGGQTRIGQALRQLLLDERSASLSALVVITDGGQNAGIDPAVAVAMAQEFKVPIHVIGMGSDRRPVNVRVSDFVAPARAYPGDRFAVTGYLQAQGLAGRQITVDLTSHGGGAQPGTTLATQIVMLKDDGEVTPVRFELEGIEEPGRRTLRLAIRPPSEDRNPADNQQEVDIEIVDRKTQVLLVAGGPSREFQFLRNLLRRDKDVVVHELLQTAGPEVMLRDEVVHDTFPDSMAELGDYDVIVAFDPDWRALGRDQIDTLEKWVAEQSGGLVVIAGPVHTDSWVQDARMASLRALYPVEFNRRFTLIDDARFGSKTPWPIEFTREGLEAEFLWLDHSASASETAWNNFKGVYGYFQVRGPKPGATVYGRFSDPDASRGADGQAPVYMAGHIFGSGRVFYLASGELWRLRELDDAYFEQIYTKLIRHVSQGRLLRGSRLGSLLVDRDRYVLGNTVVVRAQLSDAQHRPLEIPKVNAQVIQPDSTVLNLTLDADTTRKGMYSAEFPALQEGVYRIELPLPHSPEEPLVRRVQVRVPDLERENPQRNDALLSMIAERTGGIYYVGLEAARGWQGAPPLAAQLKDRSQTTFISSAPDREWTKFWMRMLLFVICGCLCAEWLIRRLCRLA